MKSNFLRESIADANQMRAAAIASAKAQLEEAFKPHFANVLTSKLRTELQDSSCDGHGADEGGETDAQAVSEQNTLDSSDVATSDNKEPSKNSNDSSDVQNPGQEVKAFGKGKPDPKPVGEATDGAVVNGDAHEKVLDKLTEDDELDLDGDDLETDSEFDLDGDEETGEDTDLDDLDAIIKSLEADLKDEQPSDAPTGHEFGDEPEVEEDLSAAARRDSVVQTMDAEPDLSPAGVGDKTLELDEGDEDVDLDEIMREVVSDDDDAAMNPNKYLKVTERLKSENAELKQNLKEHRDVIRFLKDRINEINMLNAKLLFTNKLFKQHNLNPGQKMHVVETFDRATTLREVKLVYSTLAEAYSGKEASLPKTMKNVTEGLASKAVGSTKPRTQQVLSESDETVARFKKLAGIIKS